MMLRQSLLDPLSIQMEYLNNCENHSLFFYT